MFKRAAQVGRPCLLGYIDRCSAPCTGAISPADHRALAEDLADFMAGHTGRFVARVEAEMRTAAAELDFERAARLRDDLGALTKALEKSAVVLPDATDADVFALADDELEAAVQVFHVRGGRVRGQRGWVVEKTEDVSAPDLVQQLLLQVYGDTTPASPDEDGTTGTSSSVPREVLVPVEPTDLAQTTAWLSGLRGAAVDVRVPRRGDKRALAETVHRNAEGALKLHKSRRGGDLTTRGQALAQIQEALGPGRGAAAHRVLRRLPPAGHRGGGLDGGLRGRPAPQGRVPALRRAGAVRRGRRRERPRGRRHRRRLLDARGHHTPLPPPGPRRGGGGRALGCWTRPPGS